MLPMVTHTSLFSQQTLGASHGRLAVLKEPLNVYTEHIHSILKPHGEHASSSRTVLPLMNMELAVQRERPLSQIVLLAPFRSV